MYKKFLPKKLLSKRLLISVLSTSLLAGSVSIPAMAWGESAAADSKTANAGLSTQLNAGIPPLPTQANNLKYQLRRIHAAILPEDLPVLKEARERARELNDPSLFAEIGSKLVLAKSGKTGYDSVTPEALLELVNDLAFDYDPDLNGLALVRAKHTALLSDLIRLSGNPAGLDGIDYGDLTAFSLSYVSHLKTAVSGKDVTQLLDRKTVSALLNQALAETLDESDLVVSQIIGGLGITADDIISVKNRVSVIVDPDGKAKLALALAVARSRAVYKETADSSRKTIVPEVWVFGRQVPASLIEWQEVKDVPKAAVKDGKIVLVSGKGAVVTVRAVLKGINKPLLDSQVVYLGKANPNQPQLPEGAQYLVDRLNEVHAAIRPEDLPSIRQSRDKLAALTDTKLISDIWKPIAKKKGKKAGFEQVTEKNILAFIAGLGITYDSGFSELEQLRQDNAELLNQLVVLSGEPKGTAAISFADLTEFLLAYEKEIQSGILSEKGKSKEQLLLTFLSDKYSEKAWNKVLANKKLKISAVLSGLGIKGKDIAATNSRIAGAIDPLYRAQFGLVLAYIKTLGIDPASLGIDLDNINFGDSAS